MRRIPTIGRAADAGRPTVFCPRRAVCEKYRRVRRADTTAQPLRTPARGRGVAAAAYAVRSGLSWKQLRMGVAERSSWFIGGSPRISSIVLTMLVWL